MAVEYSVEVCKRLEDRFREANLHRPMRVEHFDAGDELSYDVTGIDRANTGRVSLVVEKFVGGGFAGQVYRVKITSIKADDGEIGSLETGGVYAMKILIPPSSFSRIFRNLLYAVGFQGPFQLQVNPIAARAGALWQKFIRRAAKIRFGDEMAVNDIHATFIDNRLGSCGELSDWVDGRTWRLEVDEHLDSLSRWHKGKKVDTDKLGSLEYRAKKEFMADFVKLLHDMGGYEFARQYEWSTCKSQPNCLKRKETGDNPLEGLTAVDFRAGLALLVFLPMSPGDFKLIWQGIKRGTLVQFDRGDLDKLEAFVNAKGDAFADMPAMLEELKADERVYRDSVIDITHNHVRLLYSGQLWSTILSSAVTGWRTRNLIDNSCEQKLRANRVSRLLFFVIGLIPFLGRFVRRIWGRADYRRHYFSILASASYLKRAVRCKIIEKVIVWHRAGRADENAAPQIAESNWLFLRHLPLSILPAGLHRFFTDTQFARERLAYVFVRPVRLYFNTELREQWLNDMVTKGRKKHILSDEDADVILSQLEEPFIQKYLKSLAVHVCTLPVTQVVSVIVATIYWIKHPELSFEEVKWRVAGILLAFQLTPISPGSLVRGFYVLYIVIKERNFKDYNIAVFLSFFKYIGYLAFPIQMTYHYPVMARFMASHWATEAVHFIKVFGERGALLEHWVFCLFYNWPLTIRRRMRRRAELRAKMKPRYWHVGLCAIIAAGLFRYSDLVYLRFTAVLPGLKDLWWLTAALPLICGVLITLYCGGAPLARRIIAGTICGASMGVLYTAILTIFGNDVDIAATAIISGCVWRVFVFAIFSTLGVILTELKLPDPDLI